MSAELLTRRSFVAALAALTGSAATLGLAGCGSNPARSYYDDLHHGEGWLEGFSADCEISVDPVTLVIYIDDAMKDYGNPRLPRMQHIVDNYHENYGRAGVTIDFRWCTYEEVVAYAREGMPEDADGFMGEMEATLAAIEAGYLYDGIAHTSRRDIEWFNLSPVMFRPEGSEVTLPAPNTYNGEDLSDDDSGEYETRMMHLPEFDGAVAICADGTRQGKAARMCLYQAGFYSAEDGQGGEIDASVIDKLVVFDEVEEVFDAVRDGVCELGIAFASDMNWHEGFRVAYTPDNAYGYNISSASVIGSPRAAQVRDFLQFARIMQ